MSFSLAHLSDLHIGPLPGGSRLTDYAGKRLIGRMSWMRKRRFIHATEVLEAVIADIAAHAPDHVAVTGDLINIALPAEFPLAAGLLARLGAPDRVTLVPGNHDAYVLTPWANGVGLWSDYMTGDMRMPGQAFSAGIAAVFPFVRQRRNVALVGLCSAHPQALHRASGALGESQRAHLAEILAILGTRGYFRCVLIHHPPLPGLAKPRKALRDAAELTDLLRENGAELVLHGHNHRRSSLMLGEARISGVPSASSRGGHGADPGGWTLFRIARRDGAWSVSETRRVFDPATGGMIDEA